MNTYLSRKTLIPGTNDQEVYKKAILIYRRLIAHTKRRPYVRSAYFGNQKIFLNYFWQHLWQKNWKDRTRRLKLFACAIDLIKHSKFLTSTKINPNNHSELLHRFFGKSRGGESFVVQIKENITNGEKHLISIFPS
ncbi:hypothetical protein IPJ72_00545 [Candidatus Peregrinibacteria bacterium]|nr:MAG: hypothetical protein IPJ72_00545 [Candidatus Peregrinibacteria bacterium]